MRKFSANLSMLFNELAFLDRFAAASNAGFRGVEYISPYDHDPAKIADLLQQNGLEQVLFNLPVGDWAAGERGIAVLPERKHEFRDGVARAVRYAKALRCPQVNCLAGIAPAHVDVAILRQTLIENLRYASGELAANNIRLLIEPINTRDMPGFFLNTSTDALGVIAEVGSPNLFLQYDIYHMHIMEHDLPASIARAFGKIKHVQIADDPGRHEPGTGTIDYPAVLGQLDGLGYDGWIGAEYKPQASTAEGLGWMTRLSGRHSA